MTDDEARLQAHNALRDSMNGEGKDGETIAFLVDQFRDAVEAQLFEVAKAANEQLMKHGLQIAVQSKAGWKDATFNLIPYTEGQERAFNLSPETAGQQPAVHNPHESYTLRAVENVVFGREGWAIDAPGGEMIAVVKGREKAELIHGLLEQAAAQELMKVWSQAYEAALEEDEDDFEGAQKKADAAVARAMIPA